jgi:hypothetical protein
MAVRKVDRCVVELYETRRLTTFTRRAGFDRRWLSASHPHYSSASCLDLSRCANISSRAVDDSGSPERALCSAQRTADRRLFRRKSFSARCSPPHIQRPPSPNLCDYSTLLDRIEGRTKPGSASTSSTFHSILPPLAASVFSIFIRRTSTTATSHALLTPSLHSLRRFKLKSS